MDQHESTRPSTAAQEPSSTAAPAPAPVPGTPGPAGPARQGLAQRLAQPMRYRVEASLTATLTAVGVLGIVLVTVLMGAREGCYALALMLGAAAVARLVLPTGRAGIFAVRSRGLDVALIGLSAIAIGVLTWLSPLD